MVSDYKGVLHWLVLLALLPPLVNATESEEDLCQALTCRTCADQRARTEDEPFSLCPEFGQVYQPEEDEAVTEVNPESGQDQAEGTPPPEEEEEIQVEGTPPPEEEHKMSTPTCGDLIKNLTSIVHVIEKVTKGSGLVSISALSLYIVYIVVISSLALSRYLERKRSEELQTSARAVERTARRLIRQSSSSRGRRSRSPSRDDITLA